MEAGEMHMMWEQLQKGINPNKCTQRLVLFMRKNKQGKILVYKNSS